MSEQKEKEGIGNKEERTPFGNRAIEALLEQEHNSTAAKFIEETEREHGLDCWDRFVKSPDGTLDLLGLGVLYGMFLMAEIELEFDAIAEAKVGDPDVSCEDCGVKRVEVYNDPNLVISVCSYKEEKCCCLYTKGKAPALTSGDVVAAIELYSLIRDL